MDDYDYTKNFPDFVIVNSVEEVCRRVALAKERIKKTGGLTEKVFWESVEEHLDTL